METRRNILKTVLLCIIVITYVFTLYKVNEIKNLRFLEKAEHNVDTMVVMQGKYENGFIVTEDGNEWLFIENKPKKDGTEVTVIFQTDNKPKVDWKIVAVQEKVR